MVTASTRQWVAIPRWRERWEVIEQLPGGGQGHAYRARRRLDGLEALLKVIKANDLVERRARFFREATAYDTCRVEGIPRLVESNAHLHADADFEMYLARDFVAGPTLRYWREKADSVDLEVAIEVVRGVVEVLDDCHRAGWIHRDVKPDNIVLVNGEPSKPMLLDFGLCYRDVHQTEFVTEELQELGNRFLRLPELSAGSSGKQDPRSDLTFAAGILFYLLTGDHPSVLQDADGRLPHQREPHVRALSAEVGDRWWRLVAFFDGAFEPILADRTASAEAMLGKLGEVAADRRAGEGREGNLEAILEVVGSAAERRRTATFQRLTEALAQVERVHRELQGRLAGGLLVSQTGWAFEGQLRRNTLYWHRPGQNERISVSECEAREVGDEIVVRISGDTVYRTSIAHPHYGDQFQAAVEEWVLSDLSRELTGAGDGGPSGQ